MSLGRQQAWARRHFAALQGKAVPRSKYGNKKHVGFGLDGETIAIDSGREAKRWSTLVTMQKAGLIKDLERQVTYAFGTGDDVVRYVDSKRRMLYKADFRYVEDGALVVEDAKGMKTREYLIKKALMWHFHKIKVRET